MNVFKLILWFAATLFVCWWVYSNFEPYTDFSCMINSEYGYFTTIHWDKINDQANIIVVLSGLLVGSCLHIADRIRRQSHRNSIV